MNNIVRFFILSLLFFSTQLWGQSPHVAGTIIEEPIKKHRHDKQFNFGIKGGFTSSLFLVSDITLNGIRVEEVQNNYKIGYFGSLFARVNFNRHFLQPEVSYNVNRCNITFDKPTTDEVLPEEASITSSIHSIDVPILYGYNIIKEGPYSMALFGGPKLRYIWNKKSHVTFENFGMQEINEELYPLNLSCTVGIAVTISPIFFDFRYDIGLHNISRKVIHNVEAGGEQVADKVRFHRRDNVLSFSLGCFF